MDILKLATDWAKAEVFSTSFFIIFGILFMLASIGFWQLGKTDLAKAYIVPSMVSGILLLTIGLGLLFTNLSRIKSFETEYNKGTSTFVESELIRIDKTLEEYSIVFKVVPLIVVLSALLIIFIPTPTWRAISITTITMMIVILIIDGNAHARMEAYKEQLVSLVTIN